MRLGRQMHAVEDHHHRHRDHRDAPRIEALRRPAGEQRQRQGARQAHARADHHLGRRMHPQRQAGDADDERGQRGQRQHDGAPSQQQRGKPARDDGGRRDMAAGRADIGRAEACRAGNEHQLERQHRGKRGDDDQRPGAGAAPPALREQCDADRKAIGRMTAWSAKSVRKVTGGKLSAKCFRDLQRQHGLIGPAAMRCGCSNKMGRCHGL